MDMSSFCQEVRLGCPGWWLLPATLAAGRQGAGHGDTVGGEILHHLGWLKPNTLWLCQQFAIEHGHRKSGFTQLQNSDFP